MLALLNAGDTRWCEIAKKIEMSAHEKDVDCVGLLQELKIGLANLL